MGPRFIIIIIFFFLLGSVLRFPPFPERSVYAQSGKVGPGKEIETFPRDPIKGVGAQEVPREDGGKDKIYYSIITPEEEEKARQEEKEKEDRSLDGLRNIIIDIRRR